MESRRLLINYCYGRCYALHAGCNTISNTARRIAEYLNSENSEKYTGPGLRRSKASMLVGEYRDLLVVSLKQHICWLFSTVAKGYIEESKFLVNCVTLQ